MLMSVLFSICIVTKMYPWFVFHSFLMFPVFPLPATTNYVWHRARNVSISVLPKPPFDKVFIFNLLTNINLQANLLGVACDFPNAIWPPHWVFFISRKTRNHVLFKTQCGHCAFLLGSNIRNFHCWKNARVAV